MADNPYTFHPKLQTLSQALHHRGVTQGHALPLRATRSEWLTRGQALPSEQLLTPDNQVHSKPHTLNQALQREWMTQGQALPSEQQLTPQGLPNSTPSTINSQPYTLNPKP